jgi:DNA-binding NtrC family response regulator
MKTIKQSAARQALEAMKEMGLHSSTYAAEGRAFAATKEKAQEFAFRVRGIVAATNKNLLEEIEKGNFRMDLYHRLSVILIHVPTLNERTEDIPLIANNFLADICNDNSIPLKSFTPDGYQALQDVNWTGNIRELRNVVERLVILCGDKISGEDVYMFSNPAQRGADPFGVVDEYKTLQDFRDWAEKVFIERKLVQNGWNVAKTAQEIDIQRSHLYNKIEKYNLKRR